VVGIRVVLDIVERVEGVFGIALGGLGKVGSRVPSI
jgi:hypothetical protein